MERYIPSNNKIKNLTRDKTRIQNPKRKYLECQTCSITLMEKNAYKKYNI